MDVYDREGESHRWEAASAKVLRREHFVIDEEWKASTGLQCSRDSGRRQSSRQAGSDHTGPMGSEKEVGRYLGNTGKPVMV